MNIYRDWNVIVTHTYTHAHKKLGDFVIEHDIYNKNHFGFLYGVNASMNKKQAMFKSHRLLLMHAYYAFGITQNLTENL